MVKDHKNTIIFLKPFPKSNGMPMKRIIATIQVKYSKDDCGFTMGCGGVADSTGLILPCSEAHNIIIIIKLLLGAKQRNVPELL